MFTTKCEFIKKEYCGNLSDNVCYSNILYSFSELIIWNISVLKAEATNFVLTKMYH